VRKSEFARNFQCPGTGAGNQAQEDSAQRETVFDAQYCADYGRDVGTARLLKARRLKSNMKAADNDRGSQHSQARINPTAQDFPHSVDAQSSPFSYESINSLMHEHLIKSNMLHIEEQYKQTA
jgi:hypothetical protein